MADATTPGEAGSIAAAAAVATEQTRALRAEIEAADRAGQRFAGSLVTAFEGLAFKGKSLGDVVKSLTLSLSNMVLKAAFAPLEQGIGSFMSGLLKGGLGFAKGGVFRQGGVVPFASGGVIASPIAFPLAGGATGIAGERGAEAIMPLARGADGRLGVVAAQGGSGAAITVNIQTQDAESFSRSQTQVAAMIARAVALGQRNL